MNDEVTSEVVMESIKNALSLLEVFKSSPDKSVARELALVTTKLQEAKLWLGQAQLMLSMPTPPTV